MLRIIKILFVIFLLFSVFYFLFSPRVCLALDSDDDRVSNEDEIKVYYTNPYLSDTDGDGYDDYTEIKNGYSPHQPKLKMTETDYDQDGLSDKLERLLGTNLGNPDTDGDGYKDGEEIYTGRHPKNSQKGARMKDKIIEVGIKEQILRYKIGEIILDEYQVSTGSNQSPTPLGEFLIDGKKKRVYIAKWQLWMPYFLSIKNGWFGIHELPEWDNGKKEGENHLGQRVSHGCIRLGVGSAKKIYDWADVGTKVIIKKSLKEEKIDFCGWSSYNQCKSDLDCLKSGCSDQVCQSKKEKPKITTCEWRDCYKAEIYSLRCGCFEGKCQWGK